jgi:hypothetical protein
MATDYVTAIDEMFSLFNEAWLAQSSDVVGYVPEVRWPGVEEPQTPDFSKYWLRVSQQTVIEEQTALAGSDSKRRYTASGLIFVQLFCPKSEAVAMENGRKLAVIARNSFRGKTTSGKVWFRNARINELAPEESAYRFNVVAEYEYDEVS